MANPSEASGEYYFNFSKTNTTPSEQLDFIKKISHYLRYNTAYGDENATPCLVAYHTQLDLDLTDEDILSELRPQDDGTISFSTTFQGVGRWNYANNAEFFKTEGLKETIQAIEGVEILILFDDSLPNENLVGYGEITVKCKGGEVDVEVSSQYEELI